MPKILILADLHHDFWQEAGKDPLANADFSGVDLLLIAGYLSNKAHVRWKYALASIGQHIDLSKVCIFPGNHDYYDGRLDREDKLEAIAQGMIQPPSPPARVRAYLRDAERASAMRK